jgi:hypothetical protein
MDVSTYLSSDDGKTAVKSIGVLIAVCSFVIWLCFVTAEGIYRYAFAAVSVLIVGSGVYAWFMRKLNTVDRRKSRKRTRRGANRVSRESSSDESNSLSRRDSSISSVETVRRNGDERGGLGARNGNHGNQQTNIDTMKYSAPYPIIRTPLNPYKGATTMHEESDSSLFRIRRTRQDKVGNSETNFEHGPIGWNIGQRNHVEELSDDLGLNANRLASTRLNATRQPGVQFQQQLNNVPSAPEYEQHAAHEGASSGTQAVHSAHVNAHNANVNANSTAPTIVIPDNAIRIQGFNKEIIKTPPSTFTRASNFENWWRRFKLYVESNHVQATELRRVVLYYMDDECMTMADCNLSSTFRNIEELGDELRSLFGKLDKVMINKLAEFYSRKQKQGEDIRAYMTALWMLAREAFDDHYWIPENFDSTVRERFIYGLLDSQIMMHLSEKHPSNCKEALNMACKMLSKLNGTTVNTTKLERSQDVSMSKCVTAMNNLTLQDSQTSNTDFFTPPQPVASSLSFNDSTFVASGGPLSSTVASPIMQTQSFTQPNALTSQQNALAYHPSAQANTTQPFAAQTNHTTNTNQFTCYYCKQPGHQIARCPNRQQNQQQSNLNNGNSKQVNMTKLVKKRKSKSKPKKDKKLTENVVICQVDATASIGGFCSFNGVRVWCLFDTGTERTVISEKIWLECTKGQARQFKPVVFGLETCVGAQMKALGTSAINFKAPGFEGEVEVIVIRGLAKDCLLGLDIAKKMPTVSEALATIRQSFENLNPTVTYEAKTTVNNIQAILPREEVLLTEPTMHCEDESGVKGLSQLHVEVDQPTSKNTDNEFSERVKNEFNDIIADGLASLTQTDVCEHEIRLNQDKPFKQVVRRVPFAMREEFKAIIDEMIQFELIRPSESPYASPTVIVRKRDGSMRVCVDFRKLNDLTIKDSYPIPKIDDIIARLGRARVFSKLDLAAGYHQVRVREEDKYKTAFITEFGLFEYNVMPFGLTNAPATFQRLMERVLAPLMDECVAVFMDDVMIYSINMEQHYNDVSRALNLIRTAKLKLKWKKCEWCKLEIEYLGHVITNGQILPAASKVSVLFKYERPKTVRQLQAFLGLANYYRRFIEKLSDIAKPLYQATTKKKLSWNDECETSFNWIREYLTETKGVLVLPNFEQSFRVEADASKWCLGAILSQRVNGQFRPVAYWSKTLNSAQRNYSASERELLALVEAFKHFRQYLLGKRFVAVTDHQALTWLSKLKEPAPRLARWIIALREYEFDIEYRSGERNGNVDALSRWLERGDEEDEEDDESDTDDPGVIVNHVQLRHVEINENQLEDENIRELIKWVQEGKKPEIVDAENRELCIFWRQFKRFKIFGKNVFRSLDDIETGIRFQYVVPKSERKTVLTRSHDDVFGGHLGKDKTFARIKERFYWPNYEKDVEKYVRECTVCARIKAPPSYNQEELVPLRAFRPFQLVTMDILGPLPATKNGAKYLFVMVDHFSKWIEAFPLIDTTAEDVAKCVAIFVCRHGVPDSILSDLGTNFQAVLISQLYEQLDVHRLRTTAYHPQCDGESERFMRTIQQMFSCYLADHPSDWDELVPKLVFAYCTSTHATTGLTPFEVVYGRKPKMPADLIFPEPELDFLIDVNTYAAKLKEDLVEVYRFVARRSELKVEKMKFNADRKNRPSRYDVGDRVYMFDETKKKGPNKKIGWKWLGPYTIIEKRSESTYVLKPDKRGRIVVANSARLKKCFSPKFDSLRLANLSSVLHSTEMHANQTVERNAQELEIVDSIREDDRSEVREHGDGSSGNRNQQNNVSGNMENDDVTSSESMWLDPGYLALQESNRRVDNSLAQQTENESSSSIDFEPNYYYKKQISNQQQQQATSHRPVRNRKPPSRLGFD